MDAKEEVRSRLSIVDVIGEYVQLKRAGRSYKGISPFTGEKTPSFFVSPEKQIWHCFSTNKGGDIFSFVMEVEGLDFKGALELLARKAGVDLSQFQHGDGSLAKKRERIAQATQLAERYFQQAMVKSEAALQYIFKKRGLSKEAVTAFGIGYAPESYEALTSLLLKRGYTSGELIDAGLAVRRRSVGDIFRGRMMVPLRDAQGRTVGFTGRLINDAAKAPKYLNTPQTLLYDKSRHIFGLDLAKEAIRVNDYVVLVEGQLDVVSSHQAGVRQVVATAGTALTEHHVRTLMRFTPNIRLCFDSDKAGIAATERAIPLAGAAGAELMVITLPEGVKDADELIKQDPDAWRRVLESPRDVVEWIIDEYAAKHNLQSTQDQEKLIEKVLELLRNVTSYTKRERYLDYLAKFVGSTLQVRNRLAEMASGLEDEKVFHKVSKELSRDAYVYQDDYLGLCAVYPEVRDTMSRLNPEMLFGDRRQKFFKILLDVGNQRISEELIKGRADLQEIDTYVKIILFKAEERYGGPKWSSTDLYHEAVNLARRSAKDKREQRLKEISEAIAAAHARGDEIKLAELTKAYQDLRKES